MRLKLIVCGVTTLVPMLLLAGCGVDQINSVEMNVQSAGVAGRAFGGQQPLAGATIAVVAMGTTGYGSPGTVLAETTTDSNGNFTLPTYTCPQSDTPVYLLGLGGNPGLPAGTNNASVATAAALGPCASAQQSYINLNEVTTAATAFVFAHYFSSTAAGTSAGSGFATVNDWIGAPSTSSNGTTVYSQGLVFANDYTIATLVNNAVGLPNPNRDGITLDWQKIYTIADVLAACINSSGATSATETKTTCGKLFNYTKNGLATRPSDTLQAAVQMALNPTVQVKNLYDLGTTTPAFADYLTQQPNDWSIGVSYTTSALGLAVDTGTVSTLDIDSSNRIWFPSNGSGHVGAAYFDPRSASFSGPFSGSGMTHPQQVAIDANGYAWFNDSASPTVTGYLTTSPTLTQSVSLPNTTSNSLTVGGDNRINVGVSDGGKYYLANILADRSGYAIESGASFLYPVSSLAGDVNDGDFVAATDTTTTSMRYYYVTAATPPVNTQIGTANANSGQAIYTGNDDVAVRAYEGNAKDGLCIYSTGTCYNFVGARTNVDVGVAIDGGGQLWVAESGDAGVLQVPINNPGAPGAQVYLNSTGANNIPVNELLHGTNNGEIATATEPYGIGVDMAGDVWVTNAGCTATDCTPGAFTITEIVGAAYPTITPVSAQITSGNRVGTEPTY